MTRKVLILGVALGACAGPRPPDAHLSSLFESSRAAAARKDAPDLYAAARQARRTATQARDEGRKQAAADHATRARLLLEAAMTEAERIRVEAQRLEAERRARRAARAAVRDERARRRVARQLERALAARLAHTQATRALQRAADDTAGRRRRATRPRRTRKAAAALVQRARLVAAAARALGASDDQVEHVLARADEAGSATDATAALRQASRALREARGVLGEARRRTEAPGREEMASFVMEARETGFSPEQTERGLVLDISTALRGSRPVGGRVAHLASLLKAHPHGPVHIEAAGRTPKRQARILVRALKAKDVAPDRLSVHAIDAAAPVLDLVMVAYTPPPPKTDS